MLRLPVVSRSLFPAAIARGGGAAATNNGNTRPLHQLLIGRAVVKCLDITHFVCCLCARTRTHVTSCFTDGLVIRQDYSFAT